MENFFLEAREIFFFLSHVALTFTESFNNSFDLYLIDIVVV